MRRLKEEELQDHNFAFETGKQQGLAGRLGNDEFGRFARHRGKRRRKHTGRHHEGNANGGEFVLVHSSHNLIIENNFSNLPVIECSRQGHLHRNTWFHLSTICCISRAPAAAASSRLCSPLTALATILGTTEVVKISIYAGVAYPGTPKFGVQCSASLSAVYLDAGLACGSLESRTMRSGTVFG